MSAPTYADPLPNYIDTGAEPLEAPGPTPQLPPNSMPVTPEEDPSLGPDLLDEPTADSGSSNWSLNQPRYSMQNPYVRDNLHTPATAQRPRPATSTPGLMGPVGYDVE